VPRIGGLLSNRAAYNYLPKSVAYLPPPKELTQQLKNAGFEIGVTDSCVTPVYLNGSIPESTNLIYDLRENYNVFCSMVVYPVVPKGMIILRIIPTAVHTLEDVEYTIDCFSKIVGKLKAGEYMSDKIAATQ
jgi:glycine C-acetyltransferase